MLWCENFQKSQRGSGVYSGIPYSDGAATKHRAFVPPTRTPHGKERDTPEHPYLLGTLDRDAIYCGLFTEGRLCSLNRLPLGGETASPQCTDLGLSVPTPPQPILPVNVESEPAKWDVGPPSLSYTTLALRFVLTCQFTQSLPQTLKGERRPDLFLPPQDPVFLP